MAPNNECKQDIERELAEALKSGKKLAAAPPGEEVCITGLTGLFPDSNNIYQFRDNLLNKFDMVTADDRRWTIVHPEIPARTGKLNNIDKFDASFFGIHYKQAHAMDPMCRKMLEKAYEAIVDAGMNPATLRGSRTGVFIGACFSESEKTWFYEKQQPYGFGITGCSRAMLANRISFWLEIDGPSYTVDSACSSSLYALEHAYRAIRDGLCDQALVGGSNLCLHPYLSLQFSRLGVLSPQGRCKSFDAQANGYARSEAIGMLFLQKTKDAKRIYATVVHAKTNCDGYKEQGITYPSGQMQQKLLEEFYQESEVDPASLGWMEAHGTGTKVGDPEELNALEMVFCKGRSTPLFIGSVKSNVGHSEPASGLCSVSKVIISMETGLIPPNIHYELPREGVRALINGTLKVVTEPQPWEGGLVGINSFGFGGANCHVLLRWNTKNKVNGGAPTDKIPRLVTISSRTEKGVIQILDDLESRPVDAEYVRLYHDVHAIDTPGHMYRGFTLLRPGKPIRDVKQCSTMHPPVWLVLSGMGCQWTGMGKSFLDIPVFVTIIDKCHHVVKPLGLNLRKIISEDKLDNVLHTSVCITAMQIGLLEVLRSVGISPDGLVGYSMGEIAVGYADNCLTLDQAILAAYYCGLVLQEAEVVNGSVAMIGLGFNEITSLLPKDLDVTWNNGPHNCIVSGPSKSVTQFVNSLKSRGVNTKKIKNSHFGSHSRNIAIAGPKLVKHLKKVIPTPKSRSDRWISSSVPESQWSSPLARLASAEYLAKNLLSPVLLDEALAHIPHRAAVIEVSPDGILECVIKLNKHPVSVTLMDSSHDNMEHLLTSLGKLYTSGVDLQLASLYPAVTYPVSRTTPMISPLIDWEHSHNWYVTSYSQSDQFKSGERDVVIQVSKEEMAFYTGHVIDGRNLFPATGYLVLVWESLAMMHDHSISEISVVFENVKFHRATNLPKDGKVSFLILVQKGTGNFEVVEGGSAIVTGRIYISENISKEVVELPTPLSTTGPDILELSSRDVYKELRLRGYNYSGLFRSIQTVDNRGIKGKISWHNNWVAFMDNMLQMQILTEDTRGLFVPTSIDKLCIDAATHLTLAKAMEDAGVDQVFDVFIHPEIGIIRSGGVEVRGLNASAISRRKPLGDPVIEKYHFVPNTNLLPTKNAPTEILEALRVFIHVALENQSGIKVKAVELIDNHEDPEKKIPVLAGGIATILGDLPLIQADIIVLAQADNPWTTDLGSGITVEDKKLSSEQNCQLVVATNIVGRQDVLQAALGCVGTSGYIIAREKTSLPVVCETGLVVLNEYIFHDEKMLLMKKEESVNEPLVIHIKENNFKWLPKLQEMLRNDKSTQRILMVSQGEPLNGLLGLFNCIRKEPGGQRTRCFMLDNSVPSFDHTLPFYQQQINKDTAVNVYKDGQWGSYRHMALEDCATISAQHAYINVLSRGDLSSFRWIEGPLNPNTFQQGKYQELVHVYYASLNFRDVMTSTGKIAAEVIVSNRMMQDCVQGLEFSGRDSSGRRVMGQIISGAMTTILAADTNLLWEIPDEWSLEDAATVPVVYGTALYALILSGGMKKGDSVLIHAGSGGVGQAAITVALHEGCTVFTTVGTQEKRDFIKERFPQLTDRNIGNSRDTSFEQLVMSETNGRGVDLVLNSLSEEKLQASVRCLAIGGRFLEIGKFDLINNNTIGMEVFLKETSFHGIMLDNVFLGPPEWKKPLYDIMLKGIKEGAIRPLTRTVFADDEAEKAFRFMAAGKHIGKVILKIRDEESDAFHRPEVISHQALPRFHCEPQSTYIIAGGLGGFGLELADWLVLRRAQKLILTSRSGLRTGYQSSRVRTWRSYGVTVQISTADITTQSGVTTLLKEANQLGPVAAIFNLAVVLVDALFENQTEENFIKSFGPKVEATKHLDVLSRKLCPQLKHFVIFSSVSCGRGNAGQTNYGMANSVMERICEKRVEEGFPGLAVQWGAVGEVGLVAEMQEEQHELVIGGTLQQRISSCLQVLDGLLRQSHPIVASMVVAEKRAGSGGAGNIIDCVVNIIGIRDLKTVSLHSTLAELGMDSMMAVEIKQSLEREFEVFLTPQDIRGLTFAKLMDLANAEADGSKNTAAPDINIDAVQFMLRAIGDEAAVSQPTLCLPSLANENVDTEIFLIPGIEGMASVFEPLARNLKFKATGLQLGHWTDSLAETTSEMAELLLPFVKNSLASNSSPFTLLGYSFGGLVAMQLAMQLEKEGYHGKLFLLDSAPDFLREIARTQIDGTEDNLQINLLITILNLLKTQENQIIEQIRSDMGKLSSWNERVEFFLTLVPESNYTYEYRKSVANSGLRRIRSILNFSWPEHFKLKTNVTLIRPTMEARKTLEDYGLGKYCEKSVDVQFAEGDHVSVLENPLVGNIINTQIITFLEDCKARIPIKTHGISDLFSFKGNVKIQ